MAIVGRRNFIAALGGIAFAWSLAARAQQADRMRRVGVLLNRAADDPEEQARVAAFLQRLQELGWTEGRNVRVDTRWAAAEAPPLPRNWSRSRRKSSWPLAARAWRRCYKQPVPCRSCSRISSTRSVRASSRGLARPGGNATGFSAFEYSLSGKWLELLKEIAPNLTRIAILRDPAMAAGIGQFAVIEAMAPPSFGVELSPIDVRDGGKIERDIAALARESNGGLIVTASSAASIHRELIIMLAARHRLPAVYPFRYFVTTGGLISYGPDPADQFRRAAGYVDRILKGERPTDLPVQASTKFELAVNLKTAKALGLNVPPALLARADEVIE